MKRVEYSQANSVGFCVAVPERLAYPLVMKATPSSSLMDSPLIYQNGNNTSKFQIECFKNRDFWFSNISSSELKKYYSIQENEFSEVMNFVSHHKLDDFLLWIHQPIVDNFGNVEKTLHLSKCWDEEDYHLVLTICSGLDDMDEMMVLEEKLFDNLESYHAIDNALHHIVISQD